ncbi:MAG: IS66 family transposase [Thiocapsa sp.]|uniref:IS66 family transposase n=2 Tax=Thiocapsa sp. TaxID=2024551 RepID=UPI001BCC5324|nr:IS66 family transposase [Thiocapsa sp.]QVL48664.1 MAG: IS66 family transposase [Thiocapsa sp.]
MEGTTRLDPSAERPHPCLGTAGGKGSRFAREWVTISKQEHIDLRARANYWEAQHARAKAQVEALTQEVARKEATIKDLRQRLFGKKSEKHGPLPSEKERGDGDDAPQRKRGQQPGCAGHGRTPRPTLPVVAEQHAPADGQSACPHCGLPYRRTPALDEQSTVIEEQVRAYTRRITRCAYTRDPGCCCENTPAVISAPPPARLIARSPFGVSFWVEMLLGKYRYGQPSNRLLQDLADQGLPVSPGTLAGGLQRFTGLFEPVLEALYCKQMSETLFNNDETRREVFVDLEGKVGTRWYPWLTRSASVVFYCIDPSRSAAVPGAHFAGLQGERAIIVCDRYSAYKKLARLAENILLAFCRAHVRRDFLEAGRALPALEPWALDFKARLGMLYHLNQQRLAHWDPDRPLAQQGAAFEHAQAALQAALADLHAEAERLLAQDDTDATLPKVARARCKRVLTSLLHHWSGLTVFVAHPEVPMDNNRAEETIRTPVIGRKNDYGSGSLWSAQLAATLFSILQTLALWGMNPRAWLTAYLNACAEAGGQAPSSLTAFLPWSMDAARRAELCRPAAPPTGIDSS